MCETEFAQKEAIGGHFLAIGIMSWTYDDENIFWACLRSFMQIIDECNTQVGKMRQMEELIHISQTLEFDKLKVGSSD